MTEQQQALWDRYLAVDRKNLGQTVEADPAARAVESALYATYSRFVEAYVRQCFIRRSQWDRLRKDGDETYSLAAETFLRAMRTWKPRGPDDKTSFLYYAKLCIKRELWKPWRMKAQAAKDGRARESLIPKEFLLEFAATEPSLTAVDLRELRRSLGLRDHRREYSRRKARANAACNEPSGEESAVLAS